MFNIVEVLCENSLKALKECNAFVEKDCDVKQITHKEVELLMELKAECERF